MELTNIQLEQVDAQIKRLLNTDSYYGNIYRKRELTVLLLRKTLRNFLFQVRMT